jgi:hypothetical protein
MANSRKIVDRLQRIARTETKGAAPPVETPKAPRESPEGRTPRHALEPEELTTLRKIVLDEQLQPFKPERPTPPNKSGAKKASAPASAAAVTSAAEPVAEPVAAPPAEPEAEALPPEPRSPVPAQPTPDQARKDNNVSNIETILKEAMQIDGAIGVALVDYTSGMTLGQSGTGLNLDVAAAGNTEVVRAKLRTMEALGLRDGIEDILITLSSQYHIIRLINDDSGIGLFLYLALNKSKANLAMARHKLATLERQIEI